MRLLGGEKERRCFINCGRIGREEQCGLIRSYGWLLGKKSMFHSRSLLAVAAAIAIGACSALVSELEEVRDVRLCLIDYRYVSGQG